MGRLRILIVDDHELFKRGVRSLLESRSELEVCGEASDGVEAVEKARQLQPDVVLMDISMPQMDGLQATRQICRDVPQTKIVVLSQYDSSQMKSEALRAGASAFVTKSQASPRVLEAIDAVAHGRPYHGPTNAGGETKHKSASANGETN